MQLPRNLNLKRTRDAWKQHVKKLNDNAPWVDRKRKMKDGTVKYFQVQKKIVPDGVLATGLELINFYIHAYESSLKLGVEPATGELPVFWTNGTKFGAQCGVSGRAMRTRMATLQKVGFIVKKGHGSQHDYELFITPKFLFTAEVAAEFEREKMILSAPLAPPQRKQLPHNVSLVTLETEEIVISNVDKCGVAMQQSALPAGEGAGNTLETQKTGNTGPQLGGSRLKERLYGPLAAKKHDTKAGGAAAAEKTPLKPSQNPVFIAYVESFWFTAWKLVYPGIQFNEYMQKQAKNAIWYGVYGGFQDNWTDQQWENYHRQALERLRLAGNYYEKRPEKSPPMPYAQFVAGTGYFDAQNKQGFIGTHAWQDKQEDWKRQRDLNAALIRAQREISYCKEGKTGKLQKRLREKSLTELFKFHENRIRPYGQNGLDKFYQMFA